MTKKKTIEPDYRSFENRQSFGDYQSDEEKKLRDELKAYRKEHKQPWYMGGTSPNADRKEVKL